MSGKTTIEWTAHPGYVGAVWNPTTGCTRVSAGCDNCYAFALHDKRFASNLKAAKDAGAHRMNAIAQLTVSETIIARARTLGVTLPFPKQYDLPFSRVQLLPDRLDVPLRTRKPTCWFVDSMTDLFHEDVPDEFIDRVWAAMALADRHRFLILTKRPERMREYVMRADFHRINVAARELTGRDIAVLPTQEHGMVGTPWPLANIWLGTSVEDQRSADERIPHLLATPAAVRFLSCEPLIGPVDLTGINVGGEGNLLQQHVLSGDYVGDGEGMRSLLALRRSTIRRADLIDWVIVGGESGPRARPMDIAWARSLVEQCRAADVAPFVKQLGSVPMESEEVWRSRPLTRLLKARNATRVPDGFVPIALTEAHGRDMAEWPEDLRIREFPVVAS